MVYYINFYFVMLALCYVMGGMKQLRFNVEYTMPNLSN